MPLTGDGAQRPHVVQPVGEFDQNHPYVGDHGQQHLAHALGLPLLAGMEAEFAELGNAVHTAAHFQAKAFADFLDGDVGIFHHVVQQSCLQAHHVHLHIGEDHGHRHRVDHVGLAGIAELFAVVLGGVAIGLAQGRKIFVGPERQCFGFQFAIKLIYGNSGFDTTSLPRRMRSPALCRIFRGSLAFFGAGLTILTHLFGDLAVQFRLVLILPLRLSQLGGPDDGGAKEKNE